MDDGTPQPVTETDEESSSPLNEKGDQLTGRARAVRREAGRLDDLAGAMRDNATRMEDQAAEAYRDAENARHQARASTQSHDSAS